MTSEPNRPVNMIMSDAGLASAARTMTGQPSIAMDTESNSFFHYPEQLCLIQVATASDAFIIDPFAIQDVSPLAAVLANPSVKKVMHGADYDVRSLDRAWHARVANLFDTSVAARFVGIMQFGLAALAQELVGATLDKSKRLQRADWAKRPLTEEAIAYAAADVRHLLAIRDILQTRLDALGRSAWVAEEFLRLEAVRYTPPDPETAFLGVKGGRDLGPHGLAVLRALWEFREREALHQARPPFYVLSDEALVYLASGPETELAKTPGFGPGGMQRFGHALEEALDAGRKAPPYRRVIVDTLGRPTPEQAARLQKLKAWRTALGERLKLNPSLLWPMHSMERLSRNPSALDAEEHVPEVRAWQWQEFATDLRKTLSAA